MNKKHNYLEILQPIFREVFENDRIEINLETSSNDIEEWDSLNHIQLIVIIEKKFKIRFSSQEILSWTNIEQLIESIIAKSNN